MGCRWSEVRILSSRPGLSRARRNGRALFSLPMYPSMHTPADDDNGKHRTGHKHDGLLSSLVPAATRRSSYRPPGISFAIGPGGDIDHGDVDEKVVPPAACRLKCRPRPGRSGEGVRTGAKRAEAGVVLAATARPEDRTCTKKEVAKCHPPTSSPVLGTLKWYYAGHPDSLTEK